MGANLVLEFGDEYLIVNFSFAYLELYLSLSQILKRFKLYLPYTLDFAVENREAMLPERLEWVAAVPSVELNVFFSPRTAEK